VRNDDVRWKTEQPHLLATIQARHLCLFSHIARMPNKSDTKQILTASPLENWRRPPWRPYYVDEDYPAGPAIIEPLPEWSNWRGSESSTLENDVYIWRYVLIVVTDDDVCMCSYSLQCCNGSRLLRSCLTLTADVVNGSWTQWRKMIGGRSRSLSNAPITPCDRSVTERCLTACLVCFST